MTPASDAGLRQLFVGLAIVAVAWNVVSNLVLPGGWHVPANVAGAAGLIAFARRSGLGWDELGLERRWLGRGVAVGLAAAAAIAMVVALGVAIPWTRTFFESDDVAAASVSERWFTVFIGIPIGTAVFEEVLFRAALLGALLRLMSTRRSVVASSVAFGLWHVVPSWETADGGAGAVAGVVVFTVIVTTFAGVGFALLRVWSKSIVAPILAHAATNSFGYLAAIVALELID
jgi:membrane protease YdiL (CAAX protease family)